MRVSEIRVKRIRVSQGLGVQSGSLEVSYLALLVVDFWPPVVAGLECILEKKTLKVYKTRLDMWNT